MAAKASSMAAFISAGAAPATAISTKVPSSGRARRRLFEADVIDRQNPLDAFGHVPRRQRGAGDVADVPLHVERIAARLAVELREPIGIGHLAAIGFAVLQDLHLLDAAVRRQRYRI